MDEVLKTVLIQIGGYLIATIFSFVLFAFWQRGYFTAYLRVRTSLGKLVLVKLIGPMKVQYKVGRIEEGNLLWGKVGKDGHILNDIKRDFMYVEQNVNCVDIDSLTYAFMPKEVHYTKAFSVPIPDNLKDIPIPDELKDANDKKKDEYIRNKREEYIRDNYHTAFRKNGNEIILVGVEGFDPEKVDSLVQRAQFKPSQISNTVKLVLMIALITLVISGVVAVFTFINADKLSKTDTHLSGVEGKVDQIVAFITTPKIEGEAVPTS